MSQLLYKQLMFKKVKLTKFLKNGRIKFLNNYFRSACVGYFSDIQLKETNYKVDRLLVDPGEAEGQKCVFEPRNTSFPAPPRPRSLLNPSFLEAATCPFSADQCSKEQQVSPNQSV